MLKWVKKVPTKPGIYLRSNMGHVSKEVVYSIPGPKPPYDLCVSGPSVSATRLWGPNGWHGAKEMWWYGPIPKPPESE